MEGKRRALLKTQSNVITNRAFVFVCIIYHPKRRTAAPPRVFPTRHVALVKFLYICCIFVKKWLKSRCIRLLRRYLPLKNPEFVVYLHLFVLFLQISVDFMNHIRIIRTISTTSWEQTSEMILTLLKIFGELKWKNNY